MEAFLKKRKELNQCLEDKDYNQARVILKELYSIGIQLMESCNNYIPQNEVDKVKNDFRATIVKQFLNNFQKTKKNIDVFEEISLFLTGNYPGGYERLLYIYLRNKEAIDSIDDLSRTILQDCLKKFVTLGCGYDCYSIISTYGIIPKADIGADCHNLIKRIEFLRLCMKKWENDNSIDQHKLLANEAIMYYYLGGAAHSFLQFDDVIDCMDEPMAPKELFYYTLTSKIISQEFDTISNDALKRIGDSDSLSKYYKGHIYLLKGEKKQAEYQFQQSLSFRYSKIMLDYLIYGKEYYCTPKVCSFDPMKQGYELFDDFHHFHECMIAFRGYDTPSKIHCFFKVDTVAVENRIKLQEAEKLTEHLYIDLNSRNIRLSDKEYKKRIAILDDLLGTRDPKVRRAFYETNQAIKDFPHKAEIQIGLTIQNFEINNIDFYAILIYNYYFRHIIDQEAVINLSAFVMAVAKKKLEKEVFDKIFNIGLAATTVTALVVLCPFDYLNPFKQLCMAPSLALIMNQLGNNNISPIEESLYETFKKEIKIQHAELRKKLGEDEFNIQCRFSSIIDKIHKFDDFIKNIQ